MGDRVECRNYINKTKWIFGTVIKRLGNLHYSVLLDNTRKCHANQMIKIGNVKADCSPNYYCPGNDQIQIFENNCTKESFVNNNLNENVDVEENRSFT